MGARLTKEEETREKLKHIIALNTHSSIEHTAYTTQHTTQAKALQLQIIFSIYSVCVLFSLLHSYCHLPTIQCARLKMGKKSLNVNPYVSGTLQMEGRQGRAECVVLVTFFHYFSLTNFFWMLVEGSYIQSLLSY